VVADFGRNDHLVAVVTGGEPVADDGLGLARFVALLGKVVHVQVGGVDEVAARGEVGIKHCERLCLVSGPAEDVATEAEGGNAEVVRAEGAKFSHVWLNGSSTPEIPRRSAESRAGLPCGPEPRSVSECWAWAFSSVEWACLRPFHCGWTWSGFPVLCCAPRCRAIPRIPVPVGLSRKERSRGKPTPAAALRLYPVRGCGPHLRALRDGVA
jgi:hypothetical protein